MKKLNQKGVAKKLGITQQDYSKWEGKAAVNSRLLERFCQSLNCTIEELRAVQMLLLPPPKKLRYTGLQLRRHAHHEMSGTFPLKLLE